jgi:hypothetical protein
MPNSGAKRLIFNLWTPYCWRGYRSIFRHTDVYGFYKGNQNIAALNFVLEDPICTWFVHGDIWGTECQGKDCAYKELGFGAAVVLEYMDILMWQLKLLFHMHFANFLTSLCLLEELENRNLEEMWNFTESRTVKCENRMWNVRQYTRKVFITQELRYTITYQWLLKIYLMIRVNSN